MRLPARLSTFSSASDSSPVMQPILRVIEYILYRAFASNKDCPIRRLPLGFDFRTGSRAQYLLTFQKPRNRFLGIDSASLHRLAGRYDDPIPESTLSPQQGTMNLATEVFCVLTRVKDLLIVYIRALK
jgi:hypothetical protein